MIQRFFSPYCLFISCSLTGTIPFAIFTPHILSKSGVDVEKELIDRCMCGDREAQAQVYQFYAPRMYGVCLRFAGNTYEAEDFLQEGFLRVFRRIKAFRHEGSFEGWIRRIIINTAINITRREMKYTDSQDAGFHESVKDDGLSALRKLSHDELIQLIRHLPPGYRTVFNLYVVEGYPHKEIAKMLNISENTSKSQLFGAKKSLRNQLKTLGYSDEREQ